MVYSMYDVEGPGPCTQCDEKGFIYVSEHDRLADYPGGRLRGTWPGKFNELPPLTGGQGEGQ